MNGLVMACSPQAKIRSKAIAAQELAQRFLSQNEK